MAKMNCCPPPPVSRRDLRHVGTVQQPRSGDVALENDHGELDLTVAANWSDYLTGVYFAIQPLRSTEPTVSDQMTGALTHTLFTRFTAAKSRITPSMRILITRNGTERVFHVAGPSINVDESDDWLEIPCVEEVLG